MMSGLMLASATAVVAGIESATLPPVRGAAGVNIFANMKLSASGAGYVASPEPAATKGPYLRVVVPSGAICVIATCSKFAAGATMRCAAAGTYVTGPVPFALGVVNRPSAKFAFISFTTTAGRDADDVDLRYRPLYNDIIFKPPFIFYLID
jgi:hypothetical protein